MKISIIAAVARHNKSGEKIIANRRRRIPVSQKDKKVIGNDGALPWRLPEDLRRFKALTLGCPVIMGRKTYDSIGRPLAGRLNIIISRTVEKIEGCEMARSLDAAIATAKAQNPREIFIIGGAEIYRQAMGIADKMYLTEISRDSEGDAFFPRFAKKEWKESNREQGGIPPLFSKKIAESRFDFVVYEKQ